MVEMQIITFPNTAAVSGEEDEKEAHMKARNIHKKINWTPEDRARHQAIRDKFKDWHPGLEELLATGEYLGPFRSGSYQAFRLTMHALKTDRERQGLTLADVENRSGIDKAAISRLENGLQGNPTIETLLRYVEALGKQFTWAFEDIPPADRAGDGTVQRDAVTTTAAKSRTQNRRGRKKQRN